MASVAQNLAFPTYYNSGPINQFGLTKREYFAAMALQGIVASGNYSGMSSLVDVSELAVELADRLIEELNK